MLAACYAMSHPPSIEMGDIFFLVITPLFRLCHRGRFPLVFQHERDFGAGDIAVCLVSRIFTLNGEIILPQCVDEA